MSATDPIDQIDPSTAIDEDDNISEFSDFSILTPSADSKTGQEALADEDLPNLENGTDQINFHFRIPHTRHSRSDMKSNTNASGRSSEDLNGKPATSDSRGPTTRSESAGGAELNPKSKLVGIVITFEKGTGFTQSQEVVRLLGDTLDAALQKQAGEIRILSIKGDGHLTVTMPSEEQLAAAQTNHTDELVATIYRTHGDRDQPMSAAKKTAVLPIDTSSLLFHRTELFKSKTLRALTGSKHIACFADCSKKEPATVAATAATSDDHKESPSLSALIDMAKAKIHHDLTAPEHNACADKSSAATTVAPKTKPKKSVKKVGAAEKDALHFHRVFNIVQFCVIIGLFLVIIGTESKGHCVGIWLGA